MKKKTLIFMLILILVIVAILSMVIINTKEEQHDIPKGIDIITNPDGSIPDGIDITINPDGSIELPEDNLFEEPHDSIIDESYNSDSMGLIHDSNYNHSESPDNDIKNDNNEEFTSITINEVTIRETGEAAEDIIE